MPRLDSAVKSGIRALENEAVKNLRNKKRNRTLVMWKDKKIVSVEQWNKQFIFAAEESLEYIPEDFVEYPFLGNIGDVELNKKRNEWYKTYTDYLNSTKNPAYGKHECSTCVLNPFSKMSTKSIGEVILKSISGTNKFPCKTVDIFKCPHEQGTKDNTLLSFGYIWKILDDALQYAHGLTYYENDKKFEVNFETGRVRQYRSWLAEIPTDYTIRVLENLRISKVPIMDSSDIFNALTNSKALGILLDQYIESVACNYGYSGKKTPESEQRAKGIRRLKKHVICLFKKIKNQINLEDLRGVYDESREEEEIERQRLEKVREWALQKYPHLGKRIMSGSCSFCNGFANIQCVNCDIWICDEHWRKHVSECHNKINHQP